MRAGRKKKTKERAIAARSILDGATIEKACEDSGLSKPIVIEIRRALGLVSLRRGRPRISNGILVARNKEIAKRIEDGELLATIGRDLGLTRERIRQIAGKHGVESVRGRSRKRQKERRIKWAEQVAARKERKKARIARKDAAVDLVRNGMSITKAALASGLSVMTLGDWCKKRRVESTKLTRWSSRLPAMKKKARNAILNGGTIKEAMDASGVSSMLATKIRGELVREGRIQPYRMGVA